LKQLNRAIMSSIPRDTTMPDYCNEQIVQRNRLPTRAYWLPEDCVSLNGTWDFHYASSPLLAPEPAGPATTPLTDSITAVQDDVKWDKLSVPGHWQLQGYGHPHYTNTVYPFPVCPPFVPSENPTGSYRRAFHVPLSWDQSSQVRLRFDGVDSAYHVWLNGVEVGYSQGSRNAAEFDVSNVISRDEENTLLVRVYQWSDGSYIEDQDQWWLSGIFRDVHLLAFPACRIEDYSIVPNLDEDYRNGELSISMSYDLQSPCTLYVQLSYQDFYQEVCCDTIDLGADQKVADLKMSVQNPKLWTAETPELYDLQLKLMCNDDVVQVVNQRVGFRKVELKNGLIMVNGRRVLFRGVNRHDHHPLHGRAVPYDFFRKDLLLMKQHNVNALRTSHYPK
jgi:beta-galactosidase